MADKNSQVEMTRLFLLVYFKRNTPCKYYLIQVCAMHLSEVRQPRAYIAKGNSFI